MADHVFGNVNWHVVFAVVNKEFETDKGRENGAASSYMNESRFSASSNNRHDGSRVTLSGNGSAILNGFSKTRESDEKGTLPGRTWHVDKRRSKGLPNPRNCFGVLKSRFPTIGFLCRPTQSRLSSLSPRVYHHHHYVH